ncbi:MULTISPECIES: hypothetical protein [Gammaproteobacteria]|nr:MULTISPECIES: hypothetical protein [Gammaproteobacteria]EBI8644782.1 hypothetical protein [Salmonella enterica]EBS4872774.1 hypothetical protein [Salmonella enterica subsp. enterica serovar Java]KYH82072.1 hypothetical protein AF377_24715 [Salmonella enterica subsp. enterica serovar Typhimurium]AYC45001.1 hypothetical protein C7V21_00050 [Escherichia coli]MBS8426051.1 hypothetical protein [Escherichia coli]
MVSFIAQGCAPNPANASRYQIKNLSAFTVPEFVKQKIAGSRAFGVGSDFVIDDGTGKKHWGWWLVSRSEANHLQDGFVVHKISGKACECFVGKTLSGLLFLPPENQLRF